MVIIMNRLFILIMVIFLFSCSTTKYKEQIKEVIRIDSIFIDSSKTTVLKLQNQLLELNNKDFTFYKTDTIIKIDSLYFRIPIEQIIYREASSRKKDSIIYVYDQKKVIQESFSREQEKQTTIKDKDTINFIPFIPIVLILIAILYFIKNRLKIKL